MDYSAVIIFGGFIAFMYMFIIRPQRQQQKQMREMLDALAPGDEVITIGGLHGKVTEMDESTFKLQVADGTEVVFDKSSVGKVVDPNTDSDEG